MRAVTCHFCHLLHDYRQTPGTDLTICDKCLFTKFPDGIILREYNMSLNDPLADPAPPPISSGQPPTKGHFKVREEDLDHLHDAWTEFVWEDQVHADARPPGWSPKTGVEYEDQPYESLISREARAFCNLLDAPVRHFLIDDLCELPNNYLDDEPLHSLMKALGDPLCDDLTYDGGDDQPHATLNDLDGQETIIHIPWVCDDCGEQVGRRGGIRYADGTTFCNACAGLKEEPDPPVGRPSPGFVTGDLPAPIRRDTIEDLPRPRELLSDPHPLRDLPNAPAHRSNQPTKTDPRTCFDCPKTLTTNWEKGHDHFYRCPECHFAQPPDPARKCSFCHKTIPRGDYHTVLGNLVRCHDCLSRPAPIRCEDCERILRATYPPYKPGKYLCNDCSAKRLYPVTAPPEGNSNPIDGNTDLPPGGPNT